MFRGSCIFMQFLITGGPVMIIVWFGKKALKKALHQKE